LIIFKIKKWWDMGMLELSNPEGFVVSLWDI